jgi:hypothetical protein
MACSSGDNLFFIEITSSILVMQREMRAGLLAKNEPFYGGR